MIGIEQLTFDPTDSDSLDASHNIGAYLRAGSDGDLLTSTLISGKEALDVNVANTLGIDVDLDHTEDSVRLGDGTAFFTSTSENSDIALDVHISNTEIAVTQGSDSPWSIDDNGGSITVDAVQLDVDDLTFADDKVDASGSEVSLDAATLAALETTTVLQGTSPWVIGDGGGSITVDAVDLDIRDLTHVSDSVKIGDGTDFLAIAADGSIAVTDNGGSLTVDAVDLDIRDLDHAQDNVQLGDGTTLITATTVGADHGLDVNVLNDLTANDIADTAINSTQKDVTTTTGVLLASELAPRKYLYVQNLGSNAIYIGEAGVTTATGIKMAKGSLAELRIGPSLSLHAVAASGTVDARLMELS